MDIKIYKQPQTADIYAEIHGRVVLDACETLRSAIAHYLEQKVDNIHVDMSNVDFIDSAGLGVLVGFKMTSSKTKSRLILVAPSKSVFDILYVSKLENIFDIITGAESELLRTSITVPENLVQHISGGEEMPLPKARPKADVEPPDTDERKKSIKQVEQAIAAEMPTHGSTEMQSMDVEPQKSPEQPAPQAPVEAEERVPQEPLAAEEQGQPEKKEDILNALCKQALELMRQGLYEKAAQKYQEALDVDETYLPALNNLAIVYEKKPSWHEKARDQWNKVLENSEKQNDTKHAKRARKHLENLDKMA